MKKNHRILKSEEFTSMIRSCRCVKNGSFAMYYSPKKKTETRIGITLPKKIGNAVTRNRIKRQVRMMCHELVPFAEYPFDFVIIVRFGYLARKYDDNKKLLEKLVIKDKIIHCNT